MNPIAEKYIFFFRHSSTIVLSVTAPVLGASEIDPSKGTEPESDLAGESSAEPNIYGTNE